MVKPKVQKASIAWMYDDGAGGGSGSGGSACASSLRGLWGFSSGEGHLGSRRMP